MMTKKRKIKSRKKKKFKLNFKRLFVFVLLVYAIYGIINILVSMPIKNIYVNNNKFISDQEIIESANIQNYPSSIRNRSRVIEKRILANKYVKDVNVSKRWLFEVHIDIEENIPLFMYEDNTYLLNKRKTSDIHNVATLINYVPTNIFDIFLDEMTNVEEDVLIRISEIQYKPNEVDDSRFLLTMTDGNYVYLTLSNYDIINEYINIIKNFGNKRGILYLDSGEYFEVLQN